MALFALQRNNAAGKDTWGQRLDFQGSARVCYPVPAIDGR
jgi:hypothetical protein